MTLVTDYMVGKDYASEMDAKDPLHQYRDQFLLPADTGKTPAIYFLGNSLGLQLKTARAHLESVMNGWEQWGVEAYTKGDRPWVSYEDVVRDSVARIMGAKSTEVVLMNSLTVNLHLMLVSFYRPTTSRYKVIIEQKAFPSDQYAIKSQMRFHGIDPADALIEVKAQPGESTLQNDDFQQVLEKEGDSIALILLGGVNYYSGQAFDL
ncbi:MAG: kynureninase, partial [Candidatus Odinarchaeota archaeon]